MFFLPPLRALGAALLLVTLALAALADTETNGQIYSRFVMSLLSLISSIHQQR